MRCKERAKKSQVSPYWTNAFADIELGDIAVPDISDLQKTDVVVTVSSEEPAVSEEQSEEEEVYIAVRRNGLSWPPSTMQVISSGLVVYFTVTANGMLLINPWMKAWVVVQDAVMITLVSSALATITKNPAVEKMQNQRTVMDEYEYIVDGYCHTCEIPAEPRAKHCRTCNKCVSKFDHHCNVVNTCIGAANHRSFLVMLFAAVIFLTNVAAMSAVAIALYFTVPGIASAFGPFAMDYRAWTGVLALNILLSLLPMIEFIPLSYIQIKCLRRGITQYEYFRGVRVPPVTKLPKVNSKIKEANDTVAVKESAELTQVKVEFDYFQPDYSWLKDTAY